jgi:hypothetical protein
MRVMIVLNVAENGLWTYACSDSDSSVDISLGLMLKRQDNDVYNGTDRRACDAATDDGCG